MDRYQLNDVTWRVESSDDYVLTDDFSISGTLTDDNYTITGIIALDSLKSKTPKQDLTPATALTGKIIINVPCKINEYDLYKKYVNTYPNLIIEYGSNVGSGLVRAAELTFLTE